MGLTTDGHGGYELESPCHRGGGQVLKSRPNAGPMLSETPLFGRMTSRADMAQLERVAVRTTVRRGAGLIVQGEPVHSIDLICSGEVSICFSAGMVESLRLGPGSLFGEMEFFEQTAGLATVVATQPTALIRVPYAELEMIAQDNPLTGMQLYHGFLNTMVSKHRLVTDSLVDVKVDTSRQRLAHDLRSPLAALQVVISGASSLSADERALCRQALLRVEEIVANIGKGTVAHVGGHGGGEFLLLVSELLMEKRAQLLPDAKVQVDEVTPTALLGFDPGEHITDILRTTSNIIDNAIEALPTSGGRIELACWEADHLFVLRVRDNGCGLAADQLGLLGRRPVASQKRRGRGIGLYNAGRLIKSLGGTMFFESESMETTVGFRLPACRLSGEQSVRVHSCRGRQSPLLGEHL